MCDVVIGTGEMYHDATDLDLPRLPPFRFARSYSTRNRASSALGVGWKHNWHVELFVDANGIRVEKGSDDPETYERSQCDARQGPLVQVHEAAGRDPRQLVELLYPTRQRTIFGRDWTTAGKWLLAERVDAYGNWTRCRYLAGRVAEVADSQGRRIEFVYNALGLLTTIRVGLRHGQQIVQYHYDAQARLVGVVDPQGHVHRFEYVRNLIVRHVDRVNVSRMFCYDEQDRCVWNWYDAGLEVRRIEYSPDSRLAVVCNSHGARDLYRLNEAGIPEKLVDVLGRQTEWILDGHGAPLCELLPGGIPVQTTTWDPVKRIRRIIDARGSTTTFQSDERGRTTSITNACGHVIRYVYGERGEIVAAVEPGGEHWEYEYDERGRRRRTIDPKGEWVRATYGDDELTMDDLVGISGCYQFDDLGNLLRFRDGLGRETRFEYDGQDRLVRMTEPDRRVTQWQVDGTNRVVSVTDPIGRETRFEWAILGGLQATQYADGSRVRYERDREGYLVRLVDQKGQATEYEYDLALRLTRVTYPDGLQDTYEHDDLDRVVALTDGRGRTAFRYDEAVNPVEIRWPDGSLQTNAYDGMQRLVTMRLEPPPGSGRRVRQSSYTYDHRSRITSAMHDDFVVEYGLDASGYRSVFRDSAGREIRYEVNPRGLVTGLDDGQYRYGFVYNVADELERIVLPNGMEQRLYFDATSRLVRREVVSGTGAILAARDFRYDLADQLIEMVDWRLGRFEYRYDRRGRLTDVIDGAGTVVEHYAYDQAGNLLSSPVYASFGVGPGNRLRQTDQIAYAYDGAGRLVSVEDGGRRWEYQYGYLDELDRVLLNGRVVAEYEYDLCGRRTCKRVGDDDVRFVYHINTLTTFESSREGRWDVVHVPATMAPLAMVHEGRVFFISFDQAGTPTEMWGEDERLVAVITAQAYGTGRQVQWLSGAPFPLPFHFQGQFCDEETGLHYNRFRYYLPGGGRFITRDPLGYVGSFNLYVYPPNPATWIDPLGLACADPIPLRCGTRKQQFSPCEAKAANAKVDQMNKGKRTRCANSSKCRSGKQRDYYEKNCSGAATRSDYDVDHGKEIQQGGPDLCCQNLTPIPARANRSLGSQIKNQMACAAWGAELPKFEMGAPCNDPAYADQCKEDFKPGVKKPGTSPDPENCAERSGAECLPAS